MLPAALVLPQLPLTTLRPDLLLLRLPSEVMLKEKPFAWDVSRVLPILIIVQVLGNFFPNFILNRLSALLPIPALPLTSYSTFGVRFFIPFLCFCR